MVSKYGVRYRRERGRMVLVLSRERQSEELEAVRSELRLVACLLFRFTVMYEPGLLPRAMSAPTALSQPWFELMSMAHVSTEG